MSSNTTISSKYNPDTNTHLKYNHSNNAFYSLSYLVNHCISDNIELNPAAHIKVGVKINILPSTLFGLVIALLALCPILAKAEFVMNFTATDQYELPGRDSAIRTEYWNSDNYWGSPMGIRTGSAGSPAQTPYLYDANSLERPQIVTDPDNGRTYYHMIFGSLAEGFIQESYVEMGFGNYGSQALGEPLNSGSASGGHSEYNSTTTFGNGYDPLDMNIDAAARSVTSGNGSENPNRVTVRQIMSDGEIMMEVLKDRYTTKPRISQMVIAPDITMMFEIDMRAVDYNTANAQVEIHNTMHLLQGDVPPNAAQFNMATDIDKSHVNAGKFTYTEGSGFGGSEGIYEYTDGYYDNNNTDWGRYIDPQTYNPWAFETSKVY